MSRYHRPNITRRHGLGILIAGFGLPAFAALAQDPVILVHKDPNCGCCSEWVRHIQLEGFVAKVEETDKLETVRRNLGVPAELAGCHTAEVGGYIVEGHVPAVAIRRLLRERPQAVGIAVPGMPAGSPGMEGTIPRRYAAILFGRNGQRTYMEFLGAQQVD